MKMLMILLALFVGVQLLIGLLGVTGVSAVALGFLIVCVCLLFRLFWRA